MHNYFFAITKEKFVSRAIVSTLCDLLKHQQQQTAPTKLINSQKVFQTFLKLITSPDSCDEDLKGIWDQIHNERLDQYQLEQEFINDFANELCEKAVIHLSKTPEVEVLRQLLHFISIHQGLEMAPYYLEAVTNDIFDRYGRYKKRFSLFAIDCLIGLTIVSQGLCGGCGS